MSEEIKTERRGGFRAGAGRPKGSGTGRHLGSAHRDAIAIGQIEKLLSDHYLGLKKLSQTQLKAIEIRYSRLRATLSSIEQTFNDPRDSADPAQLAARLAALFNEKPALFEQVIALKNAASPQQVATAPTDQHVTH